MNGVALVAPGERLDFAALEARVAQAVGRLRALGAGPGSRVGLWAANGVEWVAIARACERLGAVLVPLNTRLADPEIAWQVERAAVRTVIAEEELAARAPGAARFVSLAEWRALAPAAAGTDTASADPARDQTIVFTSGTTGRPKGAVLTHAGHLASGRAVNAALDHRAGDRWLASLPFFHVGGLAILHRAALAGACVVLPESFAAADLDRAIETEGVTHASFVEATLARVLEARGGRPLPATLRVAAVGGGPVGAALLERCPQALASYGLTEAGSMVATARPGDARRDMGRALPGVEVRIAPDGTIEVRGPNLMRGYLDDAGATAEALRDGWLRTGDLGALDREGRLAVHARREDLIVSGGENVYPAEIERVLREHPRVEDAVVVGVPDARWGEVPLALVVLRGGDAPGLEDFLAGRLARYKRPRLALAAEIPRLANGKPDRVAVRRRWGGGDAQ